MIYAVRLIRVQTNTQGKIEERLSKEKAPLNFFSGAS